MRRYAQNVKFGQATSTNSSTRKRNLTRPITRSATAFYNWPYAILSTLSPRNRSPLWVVQQPQFLTLGATVYIWTQG